MNLFEAFRGSALAHAGKTAVFCGDEEWTYRRLRDAALSVGRSLVVDPGCHPQRHVGLWMRNGPEFAAALFGIFASGGVAVPLNIFLKPAEVVQIIEDAEIGLILCDDSMKDLEAPLREAFPRLSFLELHTLALESATDGTFPTVASGESDLAVLIYSSGTTGLPKGIMISHGNLLHNVESCRIMLRAIEHDRFVALLPMFHSFMLCVCVLLPLLIGGSIVVLRSLQHPKTIIVEIVRRQATILPAIPQFFRSLCHPSVPTDLPLRLCISGGAPLPGEILKDFTEKFPIPLLEGYGLSEASPVVCFNPIQGPWKAGSIGLPVPNVEVSVQDGGGNFLEPGETGEVCVRGGNVMLGYWRKPDETRQALRNGWLLTGDVGHRDTDGYFYITDRKKDMLLVNGINVYPREIEEVIYQFPGIKEAAVVGFPDPNRGEQPVGFVALAEDRTVDTAHLIEFLRERLADYKVPKIIRVLPALPRNATGKILKTALRQDTTNSAFRGES